MLAWHINDEMKGFYHKWVKHLLDLYTKYENFSMDSISKFVHLSMTISLYITNTLEEFKWLWLNQWNHLTNFTILCHGISPMDIVMVKEVKSAHLGHCKNRLLG